MLNIRAILDKHTFKEIENYNIGIGAASSRTTAQKQLANKYTNIKLKELHDTLAIATDGSILDKKQKRGGYGGVIFKNNNTLYQFHGALQTDDSTTAELTAIHKALTLLHNKNVKSQKIIIHSDSKAAIKMIKGLTKPSWKNKDIVHGINTYMYKLRRKHFIVQLYWIPGHVDNKWNTQADKLANQGAGNVSPFYYDESFDSWELQLSLPDD